MATAQRRKTGRKGISTAQVLLVVGAAVVATAILIALNSTRLRRVTGTDLPYQTGVTSDGHPYKGSPDAPLKLVIYSDFLCGHCADFVATLQAVSPDYIQTGKLQVIFRNFAFLTPESVQAAKASECALDQGAPAFWRYHDLLYSRQASGLTAYSDTRLKEYAQELGLDETAFNQCLSSDAKAAAVQIDLDDGRKQGVQGTPTWFLNGQMVPGALPEGELRKMLDDALAKK
jgi:protein-disulfide isomerase